MIPHRFDLPLSWCVSVNLCETKFWHPNPGTSQKNSPSLKKYLPALSFWRKGSIFGKETSHHTRSYHMMPEKSEYVVIPLSTFYIVIPYFIGAVQPTSSQPVTSTAPQSVAVVARRMKQRLSWEWISVWVKTYYYHIKFSGINIH